MDSHCVGLLRDGFDPYEYLDPELISQLSLQEVILRLEGRFWRLEVFKKGIFRGFLVNKPSWFSCR